jgi:hypothetical protein
MRRRDFIKGIVGAVTAWPLAARAQQVKKIPRIGVLWPNPPATFEFMRQGLKAHLSVSAAMNSYRATRRAVGPRHRAGREYRRRPLCHGGEPVGSAGNAWRAASATS